MKLQEIYNTLASQIIVRGEFDPSLDIADLTVSSKSVRPGTLFVALPSVWDGKHGGEQFIPQALTLGAAAVLSVLPRPADFSAPWLQVRDAHSSLSLLARAFYPRQPGSVVAVTGTNGKSSIVDFTFQIWERTGLACARMGTIGVHDSCGRDYAGFEGLTTPDAIVVHRTLDELAGHGITHTAMEASSHALVQHRMDSVKVNAAAFTNLTHEHLDYHKDVEDYFQAKARLFSELLQADGIGIINVDDLRAESLKHILKGRGIKTITYGSKDADIQFSIEDLHHEGLDLKLSVFGKHYDVHFPLIGHFQVSNAMCALANALMTGVDEEMAVNALRQLRSVPGRLQKVGRQIYVDYAHSPDALATALTALRSHTQGRLHVVFGCGGNRDPYKRPLMGEIASRLADAVYVTDDNPRLEDAALIRKQILEACPGALEYASREEAIVQAVAALQKSDILLIAGKGHETGQIVGTEVLPFNDVTMAEQALASTGTK